MVGRFFSGVGMLLRGFGFWSRRPGVMALGLIPAAIVFVLIVAGLATLAVNLAGIADWMTPFADEWVEPWPVVVQVLVGTVVFGGAVVFAAVTFTAITLAVGDPFYERIWRAVEVDLGGPVPAQGTGFWRSVRDGLVLIGLALVTSIGVGIVGFIPVVGAIVAPVLGIVLSGRLLALELSSRAFEARGITSRDRRALLRGHRAQLFGFGVATQLCFMIPLGAVVAMPAAVAGSTLLARSALDAATAAQPRPPAPDSGVAQYVSP